MLDFNNIKKLQIAGDLIRTSSVQIRTPGITGYLANGEVVITDAGGTILTDATALKAVKSIFIHQRAASGDTIYTTEVQGADITGYFGESYSAASEQSSVYGSNGATGDVDIDLAANTMYWLKIINKEALPRVPMTFGWKSGNSTPSNYQVLLGLAGEINSKYFRDPFLKVTATVKQDVPPTVTDEDLTVTQGSPYATWSATHASVVGDVLSIKGALYSVVEKVSTTKIKLNMPYIGASEEVSSGTSSTTVGNVVTPSEQTTRNYGITFTGIALDASPGLVDYDVNRFHVSLATDLFTGSPAVTAADRGVGTYKQVAEMEWYTKDLYGKMAKGYNRDYPTTYTADAVSSATYDLVTITWVNKGNDTLSGEINQQGSITLAIEVGTAQADAPSEESAPAVGIEGAFYYNSTSSTYFRSNGSIWVSYGASINTVMEVLNKYIVDQYGIGSNITLS